MFLKMLFFLGVWLIGAEYVMADNVWCSSGSTSSCSSNQICCNNQCVYDTNCAGRSCNAYSGFDQCSGIVCCDDGICQYSCDYYSYTPVPLIIGIVLGVSFFIFIVGIIIFCICRRRRSIPNGGYVVTHPQGQAQTITCATSFNQVPSYPTGHPYGQQGYGQANPQYGYGAI